MKPFLRIALAALALMLALAAWQVRQMHALATAVGEVARHG